MDAWMDGWTDAANGCIRALLIHCETLRDVLLFFSLKALLLGKALAQIFSILWPSLLTVDSTGAHVQSPNKPKQTTDKAQQYTKQHKQTSPYCHNLSHHVRVSESIRIYQDLQSMTLPPTWSKQKNKETTPTTTLPNIKQLHHCTYPFPHPSTSTLHSSSFLLAWQNFTAKKSQHLQSGFRLLLSLHLFLQALLAICGFFRFCYSCLYGVRLDLR